MAVAGAAPVVGSCAAEAAGRHRRRRPLGAGDGDAQGSEGEDEGGNEAGQAEGDDLAKLLRDVEGRGARPPPDPADAKGFLKRRTRYDRLLGFARALRYMVLGKSAKPSWAKPPPRDDHGRQLV